MNVYNYPQLKIGDTKETYIFYRSTFTLITVQFTKWDQESIEEATFTVQRSQNYIKIHKTAICDKGLDHPDSTRLSLHALHSTIPTPRTVALEVKGLNINIGERIQFAFISYYYGEIYNSAYSCIPFRSTGPIPDILPGGIIIKP